VSRTNAADPDRRLGVGIGLDDRYFSFTI
jgi:hypothetical protein